MAGIRSIHKQAKMGEELITLQGQGQRAIDTLTTLRSRFPALREAIQNDPDLTAAEKTEAAGQVDQAAAGLVAQIRAFADTL